MVDTPRNHDEELVGGYCDGRDPNSPEPSANRSHCYRHSFEIGRSELKKRYIPAQVSRAKARLAEAADDAR